MFKFLFVIFFFFLLLVFLMGFSVLRTFKKIFFGSGNSGKKEGTHRRTTQTTSSGRADAGADRQSQSSRRKKIFGKDEGEYVDYEEVK